ncbi:alpha mannosidase-like protein [Tulasnella sp. 427]|nr:alpha mannosidase-like protein [Tulasnella sp. 427]
MHAFPLDELQPISCQGRGPDWDDPSNYGFNDVNGNFSVTLVDVLDSFVTLNDPKGFNAAVRNVVKHVSFDVDTKPQVFETTIRVLGGLLSAHLFASDEDLGNQFAKQSKHSFRLDWYEGELLEMAWDLGKRLLPAFNTPTGLPYARINLRSGVPPGETTQTCTAGAGSLLLEFTTLSRLTGDTRFEKLAKKAYQAVWDRRTSLGLVGNGIDVITGSWYYPIGGGIGAGIDSFYEYALKMYVLTGEQPYLDIWNEAYAAIMNHSRGEDGYWYKAVNAYTGEFSQSHIDSLGAFWPGLQVLAGDVESAIKSHLVYWNLWRRFSAIPETFNIVTKEGITMGYPLRPEFIESTYFLYRATKDPFYLWVGERVLKDLTARNKAPCGMATLSNSVTGEQEDRMESFALSETLKYLYLLFDEENPIHSLDSNFVFTTEGHVLPLPRKYLRRSSSPGGPLNKDAKKSKAPEACPKVPSSLIPTWNDRNHTVGLAGSIADRPDTDYARHLTGLALDAPEVAEDAIRQRLDGICDTPRYDNHPTSFILTAQGEESPEDPNPGLDKLALNADGTGITVYNVSGVKLKAITRVDGRGYDIVQIGRYTVKPFQKVWFADPRLLKAENSSSYVDPYQQQSVPLRFFAESTKLKATPAQKLLQTLFGDAELTLSAVSANWGDQPGQKLAKSEWDPSISSRPRARLGKGSEPLPLVRPPKENRHGCRPHLPQDYEEDPHFAPPQIYADKVLVLDRGECTFLEKAQFAERAGARSVIVLSDEDVLPSMSKSDPDYEFTQMYIKYISLIIVSGKDYADKLNAMLSQTDVRVMVEVDRTKMTGFELVEAAQTNSDAVPKRMRSDWDKLRKVGVGRPLFINGKRLLNAALLF